MNCIEKLTVNVVYTLFSYPGAMIFQVQFDL